jgi:RNA polymerase sigma-70 factor (ECF subfamily)
MGLLALGGDPADRSRWGGVIQDHGLVDAVRRSEPGALEALMQRHNQRVYRAARAILRDDREAEDVTQAAWVRAFEHLDRFEGRARFSTWLTRIAINEAYDRVLRRRRRVPLELAGEAAAERLVAAPVAYADPERDAERRRARALLERAIDALPESLRVAFVLREVDGCSTREAAHLLGVSETAVKVRAHRARRALREFISRETGASTTDAFLFAGARCQRTTRTVARQLAARARQRLLSAGSGTPDPHTPRRDRASLRR